MSPKTKKRRGFLVFQIIIVVAVLAAVWFSFGQNVLAPMRQTSMPERVGTMKLITSTEGEEALASINQLHGTDIDLVGASITEYRGDNEQLTVWVGQAGSINVAELLLSRMVNGISQGDTPFSNMTKLSIAQGYHSHEVFQVDGPGGNKHFFYKSKLKPENVIWLTVNAADAMPVLDEALNRF